MFACSASLHYMAVGPNPSYLIRLREPSVQKAQLANHLFQATSFTTLQSCSCLLLKYESIRGHVAELGNAGFAALKSPAFALALLRRRGISNFPPPWTKTGSRRRCVSAQVPPVLLFIHYLPGSERPGSAVPWICCTTEQDAEHTPRP